jgi:hypothetical protein
MALAVCPAGNALGKGPSPDYLGQNALRTGCFLSNALRIEIADSVRWSGTRRGETRPWRARLR